VTAVIPTHNRPQEMRRAVESVVGQDYDGDIEVIVVFDASEPVEPAVVVPPGRKVRIVVNHRSRGLAGARNTGILEATHDYVAFLDDDDYWLPGKLAAQMQRFAETAGSDPAPVLVGTAMLVDDGTKTFPRLLGKDVLVHRDFLRNRQGSLHSSSFVFMREALLGAVGLVDEELPGGYGEDYDLLLRTTLVAPVAVVNEPLTFVSWTGSYFFGKWGLYAEGLEYLLQAHPGFRTDDKAQGHVESQIAFSRAANGERRLARQWVRRSLAHDPRQVKAWLALAISFRLLPAGGVVTLVRRMGKGI
jgi:glycosyltransferase involved in cell wall biosynthesis